MAVVFGILLIALVGVMLGRRHLGDVASPIMVGLGVVAIVVAIVQGLSGGGGEAANRDFEVAMEGALGQVIGQRVAADQSSGGKILLIQHVTKFLGKPVRDAQEEGLLEGLGAGAWSIDVSAVNVVDPEPAEGVYDVAMFSALLGENPDAVAVVSLVGFPAGSPRDVGGKMPPLYVVADWVGADAGWKRIKSVKALIAPKPSAGRRGTVDLNAPVSELFDQRYEMKSR